MLENQAVWKSNNQGFKEATVIQMGKKNGDVEIHRETWKGVERCRDTERHREARRCRTGGPTSMHGGEKAGGILQEQGIPAPDQPPSPGFQSQGDKSPYLLAVKTSGGWGSRRNCRIFRRLFLKGPQWT